jgi:transcriptional regulator GlxA family with amidase domain
LTLASERVVGALIFEGFELLDLFGPLEALGVLAADGGWRLLTVAERPGAVASAQGVQAVAAHGFKDCPPLDIVLVPGGIGTRRQVANETLLSWLRDQCGEAEVVASVCTGSAILARAGLLDGLRATSNKISFRWVTEQGRRVSWVYEARWVEDGRFFTSSGVSAGIDMTLAVIAKLAGAEAAEKCALHMEYEWHRDPSWDPFARIQKRKG